MILICTILQFKIPFLQIGDKLVLNDVFSDNTLNNRCKFFQINIF